MRSRSVTILVMVVVLATTVNVWATISGEIVAWGHDHVGQASPPAGNDYVAIAAGRYHSIAHYYKLSQILNCRFSDTLSFGSAGYEHHFSINTCNMYSLTNLLEVGECTFTVVEVFIRK